MGGILPQFQHSSEQGQQSRTIPAWLRPMIQILGRGLLGQLVAPPNTAISVPMQQAVSNLQGGFGGLAEHLGAGATTSELPGPDQWGLQTREQLGLPDRKSYFTFLPSKEDVAALGAVPGIRPTPGGKKAVKKAKAGKPHPRHPEA